MSPNYNYSYPPVMLVLPLSDQQDTRVFGLSVAFVTNRMGNTLTPLADLRLAKLGAEAESIARRL